MRCNVSPSLVTINQGDAMNMKKALMACALPLSGCALIPPAAIAPPTASQSQAVVFDIDGTLTPHDLAVFTARPDAAQAVNMYQRKGYAIVYVSTRIPLFQGMLPGWLSRHGFPAGTLHVAQNDKDRDQAADFKTNMLRDYLKEGWTLAYAYGDSSTDFDAYAEVGIPKAQVFALKRQGAESCQTGTYESCLTGWGEHLPYVTHVVPPASTTAPEQNQPTQPMAATLPPKYLSIPQFKDCLATQQINTYRAWCMPSAKPAQCPATSWAQLNALQGKDQIPACQAEAAR
jgi:hypothetical protein